MIVRRLDENHDMTYGRGLSDFARKAEATAQRVETRLLLLFGEWFLDADAGVPWLQQIMVKPANPGLAEAIVKATILETEGVATLESFAMQFDSATRHISMQATVVDESGETANIKVVK